VVPRRVLIAVALALAAVGCDARLPDPESAGARVMRERCGGCHRVYAPSGMTFEMWQVQVARMRERFAQAGRPWLVPEEERALLDYLRTHAGQG